MTNNSSQLTEEQRKILIQKAVSLVKSGKTKTEIVNELIENGIEKPEAEYVVEYILRIKSAAQKEAGKKSVRIGAIWLLIGISVTLYSYLTAHAGETYLIAWGAIIYGGYRLLKGWMQSS
ncbi:MAG: hypothetical protein ACYC59_12140 [Anaerolineaceae bacterium]